ncbi:MAG: hypothetical protein ACPF9D_04530, partial [Owenweeksia sp.]
LKVKFPELVILDKDALQAEEHYLEGGLTKMLSMDISEEYPILNVREPRAKKIAGQKKGRGGLSRFRSPANDLKIMVWRDSFGPGISKFISESFGESIFVSGYELDWDLIEREKPNIVVQEVVERKLDIYIHGVSYD